MGILVITYSLTDDNKAIYHVAQHNNVQHHEMHRMITGLPADQYEVVVFVMEEDGRPFCRAAATPRTVQINSNCE